MDAHIVSRVFFHPPAREATAYLVLIQSGKYDFQIRYGTTENSSLSASFPTEQKARVVFDRVYDQYTKKRYLKAPAASDAQGVGPWWFFPISYVVAKSAVHVPTPVIARADAPWDF